MHSVDCEHLNLSLGYTDTERSLRKGKEYQLVLLHSVARPADQPFAAMKNKNTNKKLFLHVLAFVLSAFFFICYFTCHYCPSRNCRDSGSGFCRLRLGLKFGDAWMDVLLWFMGSGLSFGRERGWNGHLCVSCISAPCDEWNEISSKLGP